MNRSGIIVTGLVGIALVVGVILVNNRKSSTGENNQATNNSATTPSASTAEDNTQVPVAATITYDGRNFSPATVTVKSGDTVAIKNASSDSLEFESDPHPVHTDNSEMNVGAVGPGKTVTFKVEQKGKFGVHNHLDSSQTMTIIVE